MSGDLISWDHPYEALNGKIVYHEGDRVTETQSLPILKKTRTAKFNLLSWRQEYVFSLLAVRLLILRLDSKTILECVGNYWNFARFECT